MSSENGETGFEDDFDDELEEIDETDDQILRPKLSAKLVNE